MPNPSLFAKFIHWAIRNHDKSLSDDAWKKNDLKPDTITEGYKGLNLAEKDVVDFIVEHYGDDKDTKRIKGTYKAARKLLEDIYVSHHAQSKWDNKVGLKREEQSNINHLVPTKPSARHDE